ncbi:MAG: 23S rRNA (uracil(1939)-C(5))-methyltransferase RlmD [Eubacteriales bacterium]|nr:23S rRNA (uracil(1939)-C(5))-methyltransferase RlmD [Eubacteriales bacterium]
MPQHFFPPHTGGKVRDLSQEGEGIVALNSPDPAWRGRVLFLPDTVPGDEVEVLAYTKSGKRFCVTDYELLSPSPDRQEAFCPHFGLCGGCQLQDLTYRATLAWKRKHVADLLQRMAKLPISNDAVKSCLSPAQPWSFRSIVRLHVNPMGQLCFYGRKPQELIPIDTCPIQSDQLNGLRQLVQTLLADQPSSEVAKLTSLEMRQNAEGNAFMLTFNFHAQPLAPDWQVFFVQVRDQAGQVLGRGEASACISLSLWLAVGEDYAHIAGPEHLRMTENGLDFDFSPRAFQQTNLLLNQVLYQEVVKAAQVVTAGSKALESDATANTPGTQSDSFKILELYCGSGTISLHLAQAFPEAQITGVEIVPEAITDARHNAELNSLASDRLHFVVGDAGQALRQLKQEDSLKSSGQAPINLQAYDLLVVDPPRQGLDPQLCQDILASSIPHVIYVSCDPATLARDLKTLKHVYSLQSIQPLDMFPWTTHVECIALIQRVKS